MAWPWWSRK
uniref:Uncharacterized protein n=1 Tax=Rhizophora mucronata TaxID=61149 RepID=A0A2P2PIV3_RHIMU